MKRQESVRAGDLVPKVGGENVKKARGRQHHGGQFLLRLDVMFREVGIAGDAVVDQIGHVTAVEALIVTEPGKAGGGIDPEKNAKNGHKEKAEKDWARQSSRAGGILISGHFSLSRSCNALNSGWPESSSTARAASIRASSRLPASSSALAKR